MRRWVIAWWWLVLCLIVLVLIGGLVVLWRWPDPHLARTYTAPTPIERIALGPDAQLIAAGGSHGALFLWEQTSATPVQHLQGHQSRITALAFLPDGHTLISGSADGRVRWWDIPTGELQLEVAVTTPATDIQSITPEGTVRPVLHGVHSLAVSPDGQLLAIGSEHNEIVVLDAATGTSRYVLPGHPRGGTAYVRLPVLTVTFSPDNRWLATGSTGGDVALWDMQDGTLTGVLGTPGRKAVAALAFSATGHEITVIRQNTDVEVWAIRRQQVVRSGSIAGDALPSYAISPDTTRIAHGGTTRAGMFTTGLPVIGQADPHIYVLNAVTLAPLLELHGHGATVTDLAFGQDGRWLVSGSRDMTVRLWRLP